jgi:3-isopropylmalate dehydrogenase
MNISDSTAFKIAVLPGDGIGPEVIDSALIILRAIESQLKAVRFDFEQFSVGAQEFLTSDDPLPASSFDRLGEFRAILLGAMGLPGVRWPSGIEMTPQLDIRERLDLYCGLRPIYLFNGQDSPLRNMERGDIDLLLVRESTEGLFSSRKTVIDMKADRRKHLTLIDKANVLPSMAFFRRIFDDITPEFPDVTTERIYVDAAALYLLQKPQIFDVLVTENMFGDILSDLGAGLVGGMGMAPSADLGDGYAVFQPSHGSAPDIAAKGIANPVATILSAAMMLDWLGHPECLRGAEMIRAGIHAVFADPLARTRDMGGLLSTAEMTETILYAIYAHQEDGVRR